LTIFVGEDRPYAWTRRARRLAEVGVRKGVGFPDFACPSIDSAQDLGLPKGARTVMMNDAYCAHRFASGGGQFISICRPQ